MASKKRVAKRRPAGKILPKKMSKLIEIALKDLKKVEATKDMVVSMESWFVPNTEIVCQISDSDTVISRRPVCTACLAGSVMAFTLGKKDSRKELFPEDMKKNEAQLEAINCLREGSVADAAVRLGIIEGNGYYGAYGWEEGPEVKEMSVKFDREIAEYDHADPEPFHKDMEKLMKQLIKAGY